MKVATRRIVIETAIPMIASFAVALALLICGAPFWAVFLTTAAIFVGSDYYYQHHAQGGHEDE